MAVIQLLDHKQYAMEEIPPVLKLQQESWVHWIISHRCYNHYTELLELIAHGGHRAPTYGDRTPSAAGGALLDAAA